MTRIMLRTSLVCTLAVFAVFLGCSGSDGGPTGTTTLSIGGTWGVTIVITSTDCGGVVGEQRLGTSEIRQSGTSVTETLSDSGGVNLTGSLVDNRYEVQGMFSDGPWQLTLRESATVAADGMSMGGTASFDWINADTSETCRETATFNAVKL